MLMLARKRRRQAEIPAAHRWPEPPVADQLELRAQTTVVIPARVISTDPATCAAAAPSAQESRPCCSNIASSAEKVEKVVSPPQKPVMISKRHSGEIAENDEKKAIARPIR